MLNKLILLNVDISNIDSSNIRHNSEIGDFEKSPNTTIFLPKNH